MNEPFNPFSLVPCVAAAGQVRRVLGLASLGPNVATMLASLDACPGGSCPGHPMIGIIAGSLARAEQDREEIAVLALLN
jgi:hypothetical protein